MAIDASENPSPPSRPSFHFRLVLCLAGNVGGFVGRGRSPSVLADDRVLQFSRRDRRYLLLRLQPPIHLFGLFVDKGNQLVKLTITDGNCAMWIQYQFWAIAHINSGQALIEYQLTG
ncbi:hypothetical protein SDJN02_04071 [Cucurbita argyrosperma subsp. argyrosperma]|nr:hypothetical protein SDJN02_04071 [Cucurbita argyrosperma subsp. argyrosperma]